MSSNLAFLRSPTCSMIARATCAGRLWASTRYSSRSTFVAWVLAFAGFSLKYPALLGTALLAYTFGLRHAVDADHISAIDNVTRKLMQENKRPVAVGFFFSLGHSTIVVALSIGIAIAAAFIQTAIPALKSAGGLIGTSVSALFLYLIALINILVLWEILQTFRKVKRGEEYNDQTLDEFLNQRGLMGRFSVPCSDWSIEAGRCTRLACSSGLALIPRRK